MADWQILAVVIGAFAIGGGALVNISRKVDRIETHLADLLQLLRSRAD